MQVQASHEDRVKAVLASFLQKGLGIRVPDEAARKLAALAVDAVVAADNAEAEVRAERLRQDAERRHRDVAEGRAYPK